jgi:hypothetical protein
METVRLLLGLGAWQKIAFAIHSFIRLGVITTGFGAFLVVVNNLFDYALYPTVLCMMGFGSGVITLALISIPFNQLLVAGFNWVGREIVLFAWLWRLLGRLGITARNLFFAAIIATAYNAMWVVVVIWYVALVVGAPIVAIKFVVKFLVRITLRVWSWAGGHIKFITFLGLSAYDPIPAMLFAQQAYGVRFGSLLYGVLFLVATVVANGVWALLVVLGLESLQAIDQEVFALIRWSEDWATWIAGSAGVTWKADFGFFIEVLGTCKI